MRAAVSEVVCRGCRYPNSYGVWAGMKARCSNAKVPNYRLYGGRGIKVCERWLTFANFYADMGDRPVGMSLDRIDTNGDYCPENCRWATNAEQHSNTRRNHLLTIGERTMTITEWAREAGMHKNTLRVRISKGWPVERLFDAPHTKNGSSSPTQGRTAPP